MKPHQIKTNRKSKKRIARGNAGHGGTTAGRGTKGQGSRTSRGNLPREFEGGQTPLKMRLPKKRGFTNILRKEYQLVNVCQLSDKFKNNDKIDKDKLSVANLIKNKKGLVKILAGGEINKKIEISVDAFSSSAIKKIEKAGGKAITK